MEDIQPPLADQGEDGSAVDSTDSFAVDTSPDVSGGPCSAGDEDGDGRCDDVDNCPASWNPNQDDGDDDGIGDECDPCPTDVSNDVDQDDRCDDIDNCDLVTNFDQKDADKDGIGDACDSCPADATNFDPDGDGLCGAKDNCPKVANTDQADTDKDGVGNACDGCPSDVVGDPDTDGFCSADDNCPKVSNATQADADADGLGDACDTCPNDAANDPDKDGTCQDQDNCPMTVNKSQADADGDGIGDPCDVCGQDPENDADADGACGDVDVCPDVADPAQLDSDGDGYGDACDACPKDAKDDADADGVCADVDNCPAVTNADQADQDDDGAGDACDSCPEDAADDQDADGVCDGSDNCKGKANSSQKDGDGDGLGDECDPCPQDVVADSDNDGACPSVDNCPSVPNPKQLDFDKDGIGAACDFLEKVPADYYIKYSNSDSRYSQFSGEGQVFARLDHETDPVNKMKWEVVLRALVFRSGLEPAEYEMHTGITFKYTFWPSHTPVHAHMTSDGAVWVVGSAATGGGATYRIDGDTVELVWSCGAMEGCDTTVHELGGGHVLAVNKWDPANDAWKQSVKHYGGPTPKDLFVKEVVVAVRPYLGGADFATTTGYFELRVDKGLTKLPLPPYPNTPKLIGPMTPESRWYCYVEGGAAQLAHVVDSVIVPGSVTTLPALDSCKEVTAVDDGHWVVAPGSFAGKWDAFRRTSAGVYSKVLENVAGEPSVLASGDERYLLVPCLKSAPCVDVYWVDGEELAPLAKKFPYVSTLAPPVGGVLPLQGFSGPVAYVGLAKQDQWVQSAVPALGPAKVTFASHSVLAPGGTAWFTLWSSPNVSTPPTGQVFRFSSAGELTKVSDGSAHLFDFYGDAGLVSIVADGKFTLHRAALDGTTTLLADGIIETGSLGNAATSGLDSSGKHWIMLAKPNAGFERSIAYVTAEGMTTLPDVTMDGFGYSPQPDGWAYFVQTDSAKRFARVGPSGYETSPIEGGGAVWTPWGIAREVVEGEDTWTSLCPLGPFDTPCFDLPVPNLEFMFPMWSDTPESAFGYVSDDSFSWTLQDGAATRFLFRSPPK